MKITDANVPGSKSLIHITPQSDLSPGKTNILSKLDMLLLLLVCNSKMHVFLVKFIKEFTRPDFGAKNVTHLKRVNRDYFRT